VRGKRDRKGRTEKMQKEKKRREGRVRPPGSALLH